MNLNYHLPESIDTKIKNKIHNEKIIFSIPYDIDRNNKFVNEWFIVSNEKILKTVSGDIVEYQIENGNDYKVEAHFGQGILYSIINNKKKIICRFTMSHIKRFTNVSYGINELKTKGFTYVKSNIDKDNYCSNCNRMIPEDVKICTSCRDVGSLYKKILPLYKKYWKKLIVSILIFWLISGLNILQPIMYGKLTNDYLKAKNRDLSGFIEVICLIALIGLSSGFLTIIKRRRIASIGMEFSNELRILVYDKIQKQSLGYISNRKKGDLFNRVVRNTDMITRFLIKTLPDAVNEVITVMCIFLVMLLFNWKMAVIMIIPIPAAIYLVYNLRIYMKGLQRRVDKQVDKMNSVLIDILDGIRVVKVFGQESNSIKRYKKESLIFRDLSIKNEKMYNTIFPLLYFFIGIGSFPIMYIGGKLTLDNSINLGDLVMVIHYSVMVYAGLNFLGYFPKIFIASTTSLERVFDIIDKEIKVKEISFPLNKEIIGDVVFKDITFGYQSHIPVLAEVNLKIKKGETIGLVGHSGAGKSTIINLLMRLYDADDGEILIDGENIKNYSKEFYSKQLGIVLQETFLFSGSIIDNVRYSNVEASIDEVIKACKIANAHKFIVKFTDGYDTKVGERGQRLSGGEKQRIAIARAVISNPKILILDEATSSLDTHAEQEVQEALERLIEGKTTIIIAHRLATLRKADRLVVLEKGKIAEIGTHKELLDKKGLYYGFVEVQNM